MSMKRTCAISKGQFEPKPDWAAGLEPAGIDIFGGSVRRYLSFLSHHGTDAAYAKSTN